MEKILAGILAQIGNLGIYQIAYAVYRSQGREAAKRMLTPPEKAVRAVCERTGANFEQAMEERNEMVEQALQFIESVSSEDFEDPD